MDEKSAENQAPEQIATQSEFPSGLDTPSIDTLLKKKKSKRAVTGKKPTEKPKWNGFAFLNDKKRDVLMQVPEVPKTKKSKKKKTNRSKSATFPSHKEQISKSEQSTATNKENHASDTESTNEKSERRNSNSDSAKSIGKSTSDESNDAKTSTTSSKLKDDTKTKSPTLKRPKFKTTVDLDKINFDNEFNYRDDVNFKIEEALNNLHVSPTYKNLVRSMKANVIPTLSNLIEFNQMPNSNTILNQIHVDDLKPRKFVIHESFEKPTSQNEYYKELRRRIRPIVPFYMFARHCYYKFYDDHWDLYPQRPMDCDWNILLKKRQKQNSNKLNNSINSDHRTETLNSSSASSRTRSSAKSAINN